MKIVPLFAFVLLLYTHFAVGSPETRAACDGKGDIPTDAIVAVLDIREEDFEKLAIHAPAIAESLAYSMAVASVRTGAMDLKHSESVLKGAPSYARSMASLHALNSAVGEHQLLDLVESPETYTAVKGIGTEPDGDAAHDYVLTLRSFPVDASGNDIGNETDRTKATLLLSKTERAFEVAHFTSPVAVYSVNAVLFDERPE